ncbi:hypothetical protein JCGZ_20891 [Jatropha curcas]|uniref:NB-ARC domain-containing protein n=1 Tax=Jatropha curcas TaxID=180498 RepID=A0A067L5Y8_JATCU|nr:hypothetical protein JCGZ_20891 [Jatropha curcas]
MEGTGKTTLAKLIYENHAVMDHFPHRAWVPSDSMDSLMRKIAWEEYLNMSSAKHDSNDFLDRSRKMLNAVLKSNKYPIVVDNVSTKVFWNQLGPAFEDLSNGTTIISLLAELG